MRVEGHDSAGTHPLRATVTRTQRRPHPILGVSPRGPLTSRGPCPARPGDDNQRQSPTPFWEQTQKSGSALSSAGPAPAPEQEERPAETKLTCGPPAPSEGGRVSEAAIPLKAVPRTWGSRLFESRRHPSPQDSALLCSDWGAAHQPGLPSWARFREPGEPPGPRLLG